MAVPLDLRVQRILQERYYNGEGVLRIPVNLDKFRKKLAKEFPDLEPNLAEILERLEPELNAGVCRTFPLDKNGRFPNRVTVAERLRKVRPDLNEIAMEKALDV
ncbi:hypothetical protein N0V94_007044 [Neodidymelliopsis sp. IMI 364377]|nr:hypothetical protein N0V94_007044 [Neodidymelliopsis sp. IMI 364377]